MRGFLVSSAVLLSAIACTAQFEIPSGTQVRCGGNSECPTGYECVAGQCKALNVNEPPQVTIGQISRSVGVVRIPINVADAEGDPVSLDVEVQPVAGADFSRIDIDGATSIAVTPTPTLVTLDWTTATQDLQALGHSGFLPSAKLRLTPRDANGPGSRIETTFAFGNDPPELLDVTLDAATISGNAVVRFLVRDSAGDNVDIDLFRVSRAGNFTDAQDLDLTTGPGAVFPGGSVTSLRTSGDGVWHNVTWNSLIGGSFDDDSMVVGLRVVDAYGSLSTFVATAPFAIDNAESAPTLTVTPLTDLTGTVDGPVQVSVRIEDLDDDSATLFVDYSLDHINWARAATADNVVGLAPDVTHPFTWDIGQLPAAVHPTVWLRFEVRDSLVGEVYELGPFVVDATVATAVDASPPNYVSPTSGTTFTSGNVLLQWTSRLGASTYSVEVATDPSFASPIAGSPFTPSPSNATELALTLAEDVSYYWRVRADVTTPGQYSSLGGQPAVFHLFLGTLYVYCAEADVECSDNGRIGNRSLPYRRLPAALARAASLGIGTVKVASRGGTAAYPGIVFLQNGTDLLGGYAAGVGVAEPTFAEATRDVDGRRTRLSGGISLAFGATGMVAEGIVVPTTISGVDVIGPASTSSYGLRVVGSSGALRFENSTFASSAAGSSSAQISAGIELDVSNPTFTDVDVIAANAGRSIAVNVLPGATFAAVGGTVASGSATVLSAGVNCDAGAVSLDGVTVTAGRAEIAGIVSVRASVGVRAESTAGCAVTIVDSAITGGEPVGSNTLSAGLVARGGPIALTRSTLAGGTSVAGHGSVGVSLINASGSVVDCTVTSTVVSGATAIGIELNASAPVAIEGSAVSTQGGDLATGLSINGGSTNVTDSSIVAGAATFSAQALSALSIDALTIDRCSLDAGDALSSMGMFTQGSSGVVVTGTRLRAGVGLGGTGQSYGAHFVYGAGNTITNSVVSSRDAGDTSAAIAALGDSFLVAGSVVATNVIAAAGEAPTSAAFYANDATNSAMSIVDSILVRGGAVGDDCVLQWDGSGDLSMSNTVHVDCSVMYRRRSGMAVNNPFEQLCSGDLVQGTCGAPTQIFDCSPDACAVGSAGALFAPGFSLTDVSTWSLTGGWQPGDAGVDIANTGVVP